MTEHPITPPPELALQWLKERPVSEFAHSYVATQAARWGADQELEACCDAVYSYEGSPIHGGTAEWLRATRRPKQPSLKEQALARTNAILNKRNYALLVEVRETLELNRRALEALPE